VEEAAIPAPSSVRSRTRSVVTVFAGCLVMISDQAQEARLGHRGSLSGPGHDATKYCYQNVRWGYVNAAAATLISIAPAHAKVVGICGVAILKGSPGNRLRH